MFKPCVAVSVFSALLYPIFCYLFYGQDGFKLVFGGWWVQNVNLVLVAVIGAIGGLIVMVQLVGSHQFFLAGFFVRLGSSVLAGVIFVLGFYLIAVLEAGELVYVNYVLSFLIFAPACVAAFWAYWLTNLFVGYVTPK